MTGWFEDPYHEHEDRWFSAGTATALVRDRGLESRDAPPSDTVVVPLVTSYEPPSAPSDLKRADDIQRSSRTISNSAAAKAVLDEAPLFGPLA